MHSKCENNRNYGCGFMIKNRWKENVVEFVAVSSRVVYLRIKLKKKELIIFQIHAPTTKYPIKVKEEFFDQVTELISKVCNNHQELIILGDFNSRIGERIRGEEHIMGPHSSGKRNESGQAMIEFAALHNTKITNSFFNETKSHHWTYTSPKNKQFEIDYILIRNFNLVKNFEYLDIKF